MAAQDTTRRLARLRTIASLEVKTDDYLMMVLEDAAQAFLDFTHRSEDPGQSADSIICRLAVVWSNMEGTEGAVSAADGDINRSYTGEIPTDIQTWMRRWRLLPGMDAVHGL